MMTPRASWFHAAALTALGALVFGLLFVVLYGRQAFIPIAPDEGPGFSTRGFYPLEQGPGFLFAWTGPHAQISLPGLDRRVAWRWSAIAHLSRAREQYPTVRIAVDGVVLATHVMSADAERLEVTLPPRAGRTGGTVNLDTSPPFVPGAGDQRELGLALEAMSIAPSNGVPLPPEPSVVLGTLAILALGAALVLLDAPWPWLLGALVAVSVGQVSLLLRGASSHGPYPTRVALLAGGIALGLWLSIRVLEWWRGDPLSGAARGAAMVSAIACYLKLLVQLHPMAMRGDGVFHAHRFENVLGGHLFFTSIAPGNYAFPYPVLLYLVAAPFSFFTHNTLERELLLRILVGVADAVAATLLYWMIVRSTSNRLAGLGAVAWYHLIPMTAWIMTWGNLTNAFGQTLFVASLAVVIALPVGRERRPVLLLTILAAGALLSHPSTCAILTIVLGVTAALYWRSGDRTLEQGAVGIGTATLSAALFALVVYYAWFPSLYVRELSRVAAESGAHLAAATPASPISSRLMSLPILASEQFGWPAMLAAVLGAWRIKAERRDPRLGWLLAGWAAACLLFLFIGVVTPVQMRTYFALFPALAIAAAFGCGWAWQHSFPLRVATVLVYGAAASIGIERWLGIFG
jgi:hypothetical protein